MLKELKEPRVLQVRFRVRREDKESKGLKVRRERVVLLKVLWDHKVLKVLKGRQESPQLFRVPRVDREHRVFRVVEERLVFQQETKGLKDLKVLKVLKELKVSSKEHKVLREPKGFKGRQVPQVELLVPRELQEVPALQVQLDRLELLGLVD